MIDLFGLEQQTPRKNDRREAAVLVEVLKALARLVAHQGLRQHEALTELLLAAKRATLSDSEREAFTARKPRQNITG